MGNCRIPNLAAPETLTAAIQREDHLPKKPNLDLMSAYRELDQTEQQLEEVLSAHLRQAQETFTSSCQEQLTHVMCAAKIDQSAQSWNFYTHIASSALAFCTVVVGAQSGNPSLLTSGVLTLLHNLITSCDGWKWIAEVFASDNESMKRLIATVLPFAVTMASFACTLHGGMNALNSSPGEMTALLQSLTRCTSGALLAGKGFYAYQKGKLSAEAIEWERKTQGHQQNLHLFSKTLERLFEVLEENRSHLHNVISRSEHIKTMIATGGY